MPLGSVRRGVGQPGLESRSIFIRRRVNIEVFRAGLEVEILEGLKSLGAATLEDSKLVTVVLLDNGHDVFIGGTGGKGGADGEEGVHSLASLGDRAVLVRSGVVLLHTDEEDENRDEGLNSVRPTSESHVGTSNVVVSGNMASSDPGKESGITKVNILHGLQSQRRVTQQHMNVQQANQREVTQVLVKGLASVLSSNFGNFLNRLARPLSLELFVNLRFLDKRIEDVQDRVGGPDIW